MRIRTKDNTKNKKGVSLIVLIITIIVMIILATTIMLSLENTGIIDRANEAVEKSNLQEIQNIAALKWTELYKTGKTDKQVAQEIINTLTQAGVDTSKYAVNVTASGVDVIESASWIVATVDGVPIPKGFVASGATGENTKAGGLVIYEGTAPVTDANVYEAKRTRNQYVWIPVDEFSTFVRDAGSIQSNTLGIDMWEVVLDLTTNMPDLEANRAQSEYITENTLKEVQEMYNSVKKHKGFYIARYEVGLDVGSHKTSDDGVIIKDVHVKMNKAPYNNVRWTYNIAMNEDTNGAVEVARSIYPKENTNYGVISTLTYGVQWDRTLHWWIEAKATNGTKDASIEADEDLDDSTLYGNYKTNTIELDSFNDGAKYLEYSGGVLATTYVDVTTAKSSDVMWLLTTGATEETRVNNIYDMAGNATEWTMEGYVAEYHAIRGGTYYHDGASHSVYKRNYSNPTSKSHFLFGFRPSLYIR